MKGLYVHVPFCSIKCFYCDFAAVSGQGRRRDAYVQSLLTELDASGETRFDTLYIGGGTPTELEPSQLGALLNGLAARLGPLGRLAEATIEANPESLSEAHLAVLKAAGVGRLSLGLQVVQPRLLKALGRQHDYPEFLKAYALARAIGNVNVDLMYGLPTQTLEEHRESLAEVVRLKPEHVSVYSLQVEPRTLFFKRGVRSDEELVRRMLALTISTLKKAGYRHYEISNFALPGREAVHNTLYWTGAEYLGLGCGASSYIGGARRTNLDRLEDYLAAVREGRTPVGFEERLEGKEKLGEGLMTGLRLLEGRRLSIEEREAFAPQLAKLKREGLLLDRGGRARLSVRAVYVANRVFSEFVPPFR